MAKYQPYFSWMGQYSPEKRHQFSKNIWELRYFLGFPCFPHSRLLLALSNQFPQQFGSLQGNVDSSEMSNKFAI